MKSLTQRLYILAAVWMVAVVAIVATGCRFNQPTKPTITVSIEPQKFLLEQIVGSKYDVKCMLGDAADPETYTPDINNMMVLEHSVAYFTIGHIGFEWAILDKAKNNNPELKIYNNSDGIDVLQAVVGKGKPAETDPHVWTSVKNAKIIATNMYKAVLELDGKHKKYYTERYNGLMQRLEELDAQITEMLKSKAGTSFVVWHPSLSYFARDYNLKQISFELEDKEASVAQVATVFQQAKKSGAKILFHQEQFDSRQIETVNKDLHCLVVNINPMSVDWENQMLKIADAIEKQ